MTHTHLPGQWNVFLPRESTVTPQQACELQPLLQAMHAAVETQRHKRDAAALLAAFTPLHNVLCAQENASPYCVRLDFDTLSDIPEVQTWRPGAVCALAQMPVGLCAIHEEITELHVNCAVLSSLPDWMCTFTNLQVLCLDGDSSFDRSPVSNGKGNMEFVDVAHCWTKSKIYNCRMKVLPQCMGSLVSLTTLTLDRLYDIVTIPSSLSQITGLQSLTVEHCERLSTLPNLGPMPCLTKLVLKGGVCAGMPECVATWPLEQLELVYVDAHWRYVIPKEDSAENALACTVGRLAGTLRELTLIKFGNATFLSDLPVMPHLQKCVLRYKEEKYVHTLDDSYTVRSDKMPALTYLEGVTKFDDEILSLPLYHLRLIADDDTFAPACETPMPSLLTLVIDGMLDLEFVENLRRFPEWFGGAIFPNLQELHVWNFNEMSYLPPSLASFTALTELSLANIVYLSISDGGGSVGQVTRSILHPSIMQITTLRTLNIIECDFKTLPPFFMPSLEFMRISACEYLYEFPELSVRALPRLAVLELHNLPTIKTLPESLGQLSALTQLHISYCFLESMPMSMHQLSALRDLTISTVNDFEDTGSLFRDVAIGLKGLYGLRKLCLSGPKEFSEADLIFIGLSLKAWPPPLLDIMDNQFPILGFRQHPQTRYAGHKLCHSLDSGFETATFSYHMRSHGGIVMQRDAAPFNFKRCWRELGLPTEAADWDDGQIMQHWQTMQLKIEAFACIQHPRLCATPLFLTVPGENIAMIGQLAADWQRQHLRQISKEYISQHEQASAGDKARILADMREHEHLLLLEWQNSSPEHTMARHAVQRAERMAVDERTRLSDIEFGGEHNYESREHWLAHMEKAEANHLRNNVNTRIIQQEERVRMQARMQALEPQ